jgi:ribosomal protein S12 methylthiotransferase
LIDRHFFLDQHGCAKNQVDGEILIGFLRDQGWTRTEVPEDASLIIVNSCGFIESAKTESLDAVMTARAAYPGAKVLLAGCLAERYAEDFRDSLPEADAFFGNGDLSRVGEVVTALFPETPGDGKKAKSSASTAASGAREGAARPILVPAQKGVCGGDRPELLSFPRSAYVKITEGCDNCCSFCAIPIIRGGLRSRSIEEIVAECRELVSRGVWELNLIGQDLAAFGCGVGEGAPVPDSNAAAIPSEGKPASTSPLSRLLSEIAKISGDFRVRLLYIHPDHFPRDILPVMTSDPRFLPYFDIPFQSGDASILAKMNRRGSAESYTALVSDIRRAFAEAKSPYGSVALRTTILTGFPGETDESFETTARFLAGIRSMWSGSFTWSCEENTPAAEMKKRVPKKTAQKRLDTLKEIQIRITPEELARFVGKPVEVLVEEIIADPVDVAVPADEADIPASRLALGRAWFQAPEVDGSVVLQFEDGQKDTSGKPIGAGSVVNAVVMAVNGVDVEAVAR